MSIRYREILLTYSTRLGWFVFALCLAVGPVNTAHAICGDFNDDGRISAIDALGLLMTAVGAGDCAAERCDIDGNGSISATDALKALKISVGQQIPTDCPREDICMTDLEFFFERIWTPIQTDCVNCHNEQGLAKNTDHILRPDTEEEYLEYNFNAWKNFAAMTGTKVGAELLLSKPQGINHGGGQRLGITPESPLYASIVEILERFENPTDDCGTRADFWEGLSIKSDIETLDAAAIVFAGRMPTAAEISRVENGDENVLRNVIRTMMTGDGFDDFVTESANDQILTNKYLVNNSSAFRVLKGEYQYPDIYSHVEVVGAILGDEAKNDAWNRTNASLAKEPLQLFAYLANQERPYTEIVTADYFMVNPLTAPVYRSGVSFHDDTNDEEWRPGRNRGYRIGNYPHAGILTSPMFLARFPSTATNRNRARSRWTYKFFLGLDIENLAPRIVDPDALAATANPTMTSPHCTVCHETMDPVAGAFQNFGDDGLFLENESDSLPRSYKKTDLYEDGDRWYNDMRHPGFAGATLPSAETDSSLAWLGQQIASDPRFARGSVEFWFKGIFGRPPLRRPTDPSRSDYRATLAAYSAQRDELDRIADAFEAGTAGTGRRGPFRLKDLFVEFAMSPLFRGESAPGADANRSLELADVGLHRLLTPEQLNRRFESATGARWARRWDRDNPDLTGRYRIFYGGIDSSGITKRPTELNALMSTVPDRMVFEMACPITVEDFSTPAHQRILFPFVEPETLLGNATADDQIKSNIQWLYEWLLGRRVALDSPDVEDVYELFASVWESRVSEDKAVTLTWGSGYCAADFQDNDFIERDENHTLRSWMAVLVYMLTDPDFLYI